MNPSGETRGKAAAGAFEHSAPRLLFEAPFTLEVRRNRYVAAADGQTFPIVTVGEDSESSPINIVLNWQAALKRQASPLLDIDTFAKRQYRVRSRKCLISASSSTLSTIECCDDKRDACFRAGSFRLLPAHCVLIVFQCAIFNREQVVVSLSTTGS